MPPPNEERSGRPLAWLLLGVLAVKVLYLAQYVRLPFLYGPLFDAQVYLLQARRVREGRFGDATLLAYSPLYGYVLAALGATPASIVPVLMQLAMGVLNMVLVNRITTRLFGSSAGLYAAGLYAAYGPLLCLETKVMSETIGLLLLLVTLEQLTIPSTGLVRAAVAGGAMALALLARASLLLTAPLLAVAASVRPCASSTQPGRRVSFGRLTAFAGVMACVLAAHGTWTYVQSGLFVPVILISNTAARSTQRDFGGDLSIYRSQQEAGVSSFSVVRQAEQRLKRHRAGEPEPPGESFSMRGLLTQLPHKLWLTLRDEETSFDYGFYGERTEVWALRLTGASFGMILALALLGLRIGVTRAKLREVAPLAAVAVGTAMTTVVFHPSTRYRLPLLVSMLPLAGLACSEAFRRAPERGRGLRLTLAAVVGVLLIFGLRHALHPLAQPALWELRVAEAAAMAGDAEVVRTRLERALALAPEDPAVRARVAQVARLLGREPTSP